MANNHIAGAAARTVAPSELCQRMLAKTSKGTCGPCILYLEDGTIFYGRACGAEGTATGEVCFNTSLEGYFEVMTDPSYAGQIVTMTYPQIGNYGIDETAVADKLTYGNNVKEVTSQVSEAAADCGIIYATDAYSAGLTVADSATAEMCGQVIYPAAALKGDKEDAARAFLAYLQTDAAMTVFESVGFSPAI